MARFERARPKSRGDSRGGSRSGGFGSGRSRGPSRFGSSDRGSSRFGNSGGRGPMGRDRGELRMTRVTCDSCGKKCEVPFRPTEGKPVYCRDCFDKDKGGSGSSGSQTQGCSCNITERDLDVINEKLNKIMESLGLN